MGTLASHNINKNQKYSPSDNRDVIEGCTVSMIDILEHLNQIICAREAQKIKYIYIYPYLKDCDILTL